MSGSSGRIGPAGHLNPALRFLRTVRLNSSKVEGR